MFCYDGYMTKLRILPCVYFVLAMILINMVAVAAYRYWSFEQTKSASPSGPVASLDQKSTPAPTPKPFTFPDGGRTIFPDYRLVGFYGSNETSVLGVLGHRPLDQTIIDVKNLAAKYQKYSDETIYPTFEMIATVAAAGPTDDGNYSREANPKSLLPWIKAAKDNGIYVILDLQSARANSLSQAMLYSSLLAYPNVGIALDPEWRLGPHELPLQQIGHINIKEVNSVASWLSDFTKVHDLPQKVFLLHQFRLDMLPGRDKLDTSYDNLAYIIQMDGQGSQGAKLDTWKSITTDPPIGMRFGWKNFYTQDSPTLSPGGTMALTPKPWYVSYQ